MKPKLEERISALMLEACGRSDSGTSKLIADFVRIERAHAVEKALGAISNELSQPSQWYEYVHDRLLACAAKERT